MLLLASDLDNTLLFSHRRRRPGDLCVEWLEGNPQGFMTPATRAALAALPASVRLLPVTTRSVAQYRRIRWPEGAEPEYAITTNGGVLLGRDGPAPAWLADSQALAAPFQADLQRLYDALPSQSWCLRRKMVDGLYLFAVCPEGIDMDACAALFRGRQPLDVAPSGRKLYFFPPGLHKGGAVSAARRLFAPERLICAGDSPLDLSMLRLADLALVPDETLARQLPETPVEICPAEARFSEFVLQRATELADTSDALRRA